MTDEDWYVRCHWMLLRLAGAVPDEMLTRCRQWLSERRYVDVAATVLHVVTTSRVEMRQDDVALLADIQGGIDRRYYGRILTADVDRLLSYDFTVAPAPDASDEPAEAIRVAAHAEPAVRAIWRSWRLPDNAAPWPPPRQVFVVEVEPDTDLPAVTARLQQALAARGEANPQVEVYPYSSKPNEYQTQARHGALWYERAGRPPVRLAKVYDGAERTGPYFHPDHPRLGDRNEWAMVLNYLSAGTMLMQTDSRIVDILEPGIGEVVPISFRTDGYWIWCDATWYYLHRHHLQPEPDFLEHIRSRRYVFIEPDDGMIHRAMTELQTPPDDGPVYTVT